MRYFLEGCIFHEVWLICFRMIHSCNSSSHASLSSIVFKIECQNPFVPLSGRRDATGGGGGNNLPPMIFILFLLVSSAVGHGPDNTPTPLWFFFTSETNLSESPPHPPPPPKQTPWRRPCFQVHVGRGIVIIDNRSPMWSSLGLKPVVLKFRPAELVNPARETLLFISLFNNFYVTIWNIPHFDYIMCPYNCKIK